MFCPKCGAKNDENARFCIGCGNMLSAATPSTQPPAQPFSVPPQPGQKNPTIATILNFFLPGIGYWYWGYRKVATIPPVLLFIVVIVVESVIWSYLLYAGIISLAIDAFFAYDLYVKTTGQKGWVEASA
jgi:hypothetical protein